MRRLTRQFCPNSWVVLTLAFLLWAPFVHADAVRFALVVGNNRGVDREATLRYAELDAQRLGALLTDLGGFEPNRVTVLIGATTEEFLAALDRINDRIRELVPGRYPKALLVVYFSGHADGIALEFGKERLPYEDMRRRVAGNAAQVKIVFLDACQSGSLTAIKGGNPAPSFNLTVNDTLEANGTAFVTSGAAGENAQESAEIQGSFFTAALLAGLRGAADQDQDHRVTLAEIYQYAYDRTVTETARTLGGVQHPAYDFDLSGRGKVVLSELNRAQAIVRLGTSAAGEFLFIRKDTGVVVAELNKPFGMERDLALPPGDYQVGLRRGQRLFAQDLALRQNDRVRLDLAAMQTKETLVATAKGGGVSRGPIGVFAHYGMQSGTLRNLAPLHQALVGLRLDLGPATIFPRFSYGEASISEPPLRYHMRLLALDCALTWRIEVALLDVFAGISSGVGYGSQRLPDGSSHTGTLLEYAVVGGLDLPLTLGLGLQLFWEAGASVFSLDGALSQHFTLKGVLGLGYQF